MKLHRRQTKLKDNIDKKRRKLYFHNSKFVTVVRKI